MVSLISQCLHSWLRRYLQNITQKDLGWNIEVALLLISKKIKDIHSFGYGTFFRSNLKCFLSFTFRAYIEFERPQFMQNNPQANSILPAVYMAIKMR